jgi:hypothetical protein
LQEQVNEKSVALVSRGAKMTGRMLAKMMQAYLRHRQKSKNNKKAKPPKQGIQSLNSLKHHGASLVDVEISGDNIGSFKKIAREHRLDFALKKDKSIDPPKWYVFFKSKDDKSLDSAFKKYSQSILNPKAKKPSLKERIAKIKEKLKTISAPVKNKNRGGPEL